MAQYLKNFTTRFAQAMKSTNLTTAVKTPIPSHIYDVVPTKPAEQMIKSVKPIEIDGHRIGCDGGNGPLGHPMVYINLDGEKPQSCGYCGLRFVANKHHHH
ncbi:putative NADH dehydrogenase [Cavenderia fasciculata]|uniref:NADH dehydrogenase n=1 Tax=Cavenderia fasciculata TaxID=261658 RepID=F4PR60_CACFS|nr:putative NADH dehydrogenase [Cavenderia fasciculata]EGG20471.1 putative NADH dehydrogenase [Cavenderia fasciculata]|eukprot:XP_004358321.1 putative NADH dehydrogenase [Cavenderia fasciculata]